MVAIVGLGANLDADAIYPMAGTDADGRPLDGSDHRYRIHFDRDDLTFNDDGSLDIAIQHDSPGRNAESNWLPAPAGPFNMIMRVYSPKQEMLDRAWRPPPVRPLT